VNSDDDRLLNILSTPSGRRVRGGQPAERLPPQYFPRQGFPNLMEPDVILDHAERVTFYPEKGSRLRYPATVTVRNDSDSIFDLERARQAELAEQGEEDGGDPDQAAQNARAEYKAELAEITERGISSAPYWRKFAADTGAATHSYKLHTRRVVNQTPKGRHISFSSIVVVGNGNGLAGYGEGKHTDPGLSVRAAEQAALRNMDAIARFERRTLFTELRTKFVSTQVILRPRPVGFGLRTNPHIHQIFKAAGIKDASAKVWGSRNPLNVIKATFLLLWGGHAPQGFGDGFGGHGHRLERGGGSKTKQDVERERGRRLLDLRT
jgi:small subunit ribosomal protein S5